MRYVLLAICLTVVGFLGVAIDRQSESKPEYGEPLPVERQTEIYAAGRIEGLTEEIELRPELRGRIAKVLVEEGAMVEPGQVLLALDDAEYRHELALAQAELAAAQAKLELLRAGARSEEIREAHALLDARVAELDRATKSLARIERLQRSDAATVQQADDERALVKTLKAQVEAAQARLDLLKSGTRKEDIRIAETKVAAMEARVALARVHLAHTKLTAPCRGEILRVTVEPGELASPDQLEPSIVLADTSRYRVRTYVEELDAPRVRVGMRAAATIDGLPGKTFLGRITRLSPRMGPKKITRDAPEEHYDVKTRVVWIDLDAVDENLVVGLRVDVVITD